MKVIEKLKQVKDIDNFIILTKEDKSKILELEEQRNIGVRECLKRKFVIAMSHDSSFREPCGAIVKDGIFPPVSFPEIEGAISSSPGRKVHDFLKRKMNLKNKDATLIVGFDFYDASI